LFLLAATPVFAQQAVKPAPLRTDSELVQKALKGDATSQFLVGLGYEMTGEAANLEEAIKWYRKAADQGQPEAQNALGFLHQWGRGVPQDFSEAVRWYRKSADQGDPNGQSNLGKMYLEGTGVAQDSSQAAEWYRKSAEQGWAWGQSELAHLYAAGNGVAKDLVSAYMWCSLAAADNQPHWGCKELLLDIVPKMKPSDVADAKQRAFAWFEQRSKDPKQKHWAIGPNTRWGLETDEEWLTRNLGLMYQEGDGVPKDDAEAVRWYQLGAERGDAAAQSYMGERYYLGKGVPKDYAQAFALFKSSAEQGYGAGQHNLATCYHEGIGVAKNETEALEWSRRGAEQGNTDSLQFLAAAYYNGWGVPKDEAAAYMWLRIAQAAGNFDPNLYAIAANLPEPQLKEANQRVVEWLRNHDADDRFQTELAYMYVLGEDRLLLGKGIGKDSAEAAKWARLAAEHGNPRAQLLLARRYELGDGVPKDDVEAVNWLRKAAEQGNADAEAALASRYDSGRGVERSEVEALNWYLKSARQDDSSGLNGVAWLYATSSDPSVRNPQKALEYAVKAVAATEEKDAAVLDTLAESYYVNGQYGKAVETERKALALQPGDPLKGLLQKSLKKYEDAASGKKQ
jgi:hypothetical protein